MDITPAMPSDFLKSHICAHQKAPCQAHNAASHQEHGPEHTRPYKCCTLVSSSKHPEIQFALPPVLPLQYTTSLHLSPNLLELERSDTGRYIPRTASPKTHTIFPQIRELLRAICSPEVYQAVSVANFMRLGVQSQQKVPEPRYFSATDGDA